MILSTSRAVPGPTAFTPLAGGAPAFVSRSPRERLGREGIWLPGPSPAMRELAEQAARASAEGTSPALLVGERGTGKGRLARLMHARGPRAAGPLVEVNCAAFAPSALEAALTGPAGLHALANGGTLFLDEVSALAPRMQDVLLEMLGAAGGPDVRVIAATRRDLASAVTENEFREDLYSRLGTAPLHLPPLRARARADLLDLVADVLDELVAELPEAPRAVSAVALERLARYPWPGNVRELRNVLERALVSAQGTDLLRPEHLPPELRGAAGDAEPHEPRSLAEVEREHIERTLRAHHGNRTHASRELGISRATLIKKVKEYGLDVAARSRRAAAEDA